MSHSHGAVTETSLDFSGLRVVVTGTSDRVAEFIRFAAGFQSERAPSPGSSAGSFEAVSETPPSAMPSSRAGLGLESRDKKVSTSLAVLSGLWPWCSPVWFLFVWQ